MNLHVMLENKSTLMWKSTKHVFVTLTKQKTILYKPFITHINSLTPTKSSHKFIVSLLINLWLTVLPNNMSLIKTKTQKKEKKKKNQNIFSYYLCYLQGEFSIIRTFLKLWGYEVVFDTSNGIPFWR